MEEPTYDGTDFGGEDVTTDPSLEGTDPSLEGTDPSLETDVVPEEEPTEPSDVQQVPTGPTDVQQVPEELPTDDPSTYEPVAPEESPVEPGLEYEPLTPEELESLQTCCYEGLPEDWQSWEAPTEPAPESFTDEGYSTDWGTVEPEWAQQGEEAFTVAPPEQSVSDVVGPGHAADVYWGYQGQTNYCALYSVRSVLSELYGQPVDIQDIVARADANGWLVRDASGEVKGVMAEHFDDLLAQYGVPSHNYSGGDSTTAFENLNTALANNQRVVLALDQKEIDAGGNVGDVPGGLDSDHAVAVTGIDYSRGVVIVNDSARQAGLEIPIDVFKQSWADSNFAMTVTDTAAPTPDAAQPPAGLEAARADAPGFTVLPTTLTPQLSGS